MTIVEQNYARFSDSELPAREVTGVWVPQDADDLCRLRTTKARCETAAALFEALAEIMDGFTGTDAQRDDFMNTPEDPRAAAAYFTGLAKEIGQGIDAAPPSFDRIVSRVWWSWATRCEVRLSSAECRAKDAAAKVRDCPAEPGGDL